MSQHWRDNWRSLFENAPRITITIATPVREPLSPTPTPPALLITKSTPPTSPRSPTPEPGQTPDPPIPTLESKPTPRGEITSTGFTTTEFQIARQYALTLINQARTSAGLNHVVLDDNPAAQSHAQDMMANCTRGHWGTDGSKPYMRYTLAGGEQYSAENVFALDFCPDDLDQYEIQTPSEQIDIAMDLFMNSPGHRENILDPHHRSVGIGLTFQPPTIWLVQLFVGDYIEYDSKPTVDSGMLALKGRVKNGAHVSGETGTIAIYYDPPLETLTQGQLSRTYCYNNGVPVAGLRPPLEPGWNYIDDEATIETETKGCPNPYDISSDAPGPATSDEARRNWERARDASQERSRREISHPWITADEWTSVADSFSVTADLTKILIEHGDGVYTILLWGEINGDRVPISEYSIFVDEQTIANLEQATATASPTTEIVETLVTPTPTPKSEQAATATPYPTLPPLATTPTPVPIATSGLTATQLADAREYALKLINDARTSAGLNAVSLDDNPASQSHADDMRIHCTFSHWGTDGLKPYMRYTLAGGEQYSAENISGIDFCPKDPDRYIARSITAEIDEAMVGLLNSPGHRRNILDPHHRKVGIGISYQRPNLWLVQLFVGDYIEYSSKPSIENGILTLRGRAKNGARLDNANLNVTISWDQPPQPLTRGQLHHTGCVSGGTPIAALNPFDSYSGYEISGTRCVDPYDISPDAPSASSYFDNPVTKTTPFTTRVELIPTTAWVADPESFSIEADLSDLIRRHGTGVYTTNLWGDIGGEEALISEFSIFVATLPTSPVPTVAATATPLPASAAPKNTPTPTKTPTPEVTPTITDQPSLTSAPQIDVLYVEDLTHELINMLRVTHGLEPLIHDEQIRLIARSHSEDMAIRDYLSHENPEGLDPTDRAELAGYDCRKDYGSYFTYGLAENIHQGWLYDSFQTLNGKTVSVDWLTPEELAEIAVNGWLSSQGHRQNILDSSYDRAGIGVAIADDGKVFFTHDFC